MITVNDKLKLFTKRIIDRQQKAYDDKVESLEEKMIEELEDRKKMLEKDRKKYENTLLKGIKGERAQRLSNARSERKRRLLLKRKEMIDELLDGVKDYTKSFIETDAYNEYLKKIFVENQSLIQSMGAFELYLNSRDLEKEALFESLFKEMNLECISIQESNKKILGGVILMKADKTTRLDFSLDSVIEDNKKYMGQLIYNMLEKAGEFSG